MGRHKREQKSNANKMGLVTVTAKTEINPDEFIGEISNEAISEEYLNRFSIDTIVGNAETFELVEAICNKLSIVDADRVREFFNQKIEIK